MGILDQNIVSKLKIEAFNIRKFLVKHAIRTESHLPAQLSSTDLLTALYFDFLNVDPKNPNWPDRDIFILGKAHSSLILYYLLGKLDFFPFDTLLERYEEIFSEFGTNLSHKVPGVEASQGSLGHGMSLSAGMALVAKRENKPNKIICYVGDGELHEGSNWEAAMFASTNCLDNLTTIVDNNHFAGNTPMSKSINLEPLDKRFESFGWATRRIDGNNMSEIINTFYDTPFKKGQPSCIVADTIVGKGIPSLENTTKALLWLTDDEGKNALKELNKYEF